MSANYEEILNSLLDNGNANILQSIEYYNEIDNCEENPCTKEQVKKLRNAIIEYIHSNERIDILNFMGKNLMTDYSYQEILFRFYRKYQNYILKTNFIDILNVKFENLNQIPQIALDFFGSFKQDEYLTDERLILILINTNVHYVPVINPEFTIPSDIILKHLNDDITNSCYFENIQEELYPLISVHIEDKHIYNKYNYIQFLSVHYCDHQMNKNYLLFLLNFIEYSKESNPKNLILLKELHETFIRDKDHIKLEYGTSDLINLDILDNIKF